MEAETGLLHEAEEPDLFVVKALFVIVLWLFMVQYYYMIITLFLCGLFIRCPKCISSHCR